MAKRKTPQEWADAVAANRAKSSEYAAQTSTDHVLDILEGAHERLEQMVDDLDVLDDTFTSSQYATTLAQIEDVIEDLVDKLTDSIADDAGATAERAANDVLDQLNEAEKSFRGMGDFAGLPIDEAMMFDQAVQGANASALRRLLGDPDDPDDVGIMQRYGLNTIGDFEEILQEALLTGAPTEDVLDDLIDASPFLQGKPRYWAERIARTEMMNAYNHAAWESHRNVEDQTGEEMIKIVIEIDDDRTAWDSYAVHGQIRRLDEPFEYVDYRGETQYYMYPPNRPNDRASTVNWNINWGPIPDEMRPFDDDMYIAVWYEKYTKKAPPSRPNMTTLTQEEMDVLWGDSSRDSTESSETEE